MDEKTELEIIKSKITIKELAIALYKQGDAFVVWCPMFDLFSYGEAKKEALNNFNEDLLLFLMTCVRLGNLDSVLLSLGWKKKGKEIAPPDFPELNKKESIPTDVVIESVPIEAIIAKNNSVSLESVVS